MYGARLAHSKAVRRYLLSAGDCAVQLSTLRRNTDVELNDEAANAIEGGSDDPEVAMPKKDISLA